MEVKEKSEKRRGVLNPEGKMVKIVMSDGAEVYGYCVLAGREEIHLFNAKHNGSEYHYAIIMKKDVVAMFVDLGNKKIHI